MRPDINLNSFMLDLLIRRISARISNNRMLKWIIIFVVVIIFIIFYHYLLFNNILFIIFIINIFISLLIIIKFIYISYTIIDGWSRKNNKESTLFKSLLKIYLAIDISILILLIFNYFIVYNGFEDIQDPCGIEVLFSEVFNSTLKSMYVGSLLFPSFILLLLDAREKRLQMYFSKGFRDLPIIAIVVVLIMIESYNMVLLDTSLRMFIYTDIGSNLAMFLRVYNYPLLCLPIVFATLIIYAMYAFSCLFLLIVIRFVGIKFNKT